MFGRREKWVGMMRCDLGHGNYFLEYDATSFNFPIMWALDSTGSKFAAYRLNPCNNAMVQHTTIYARRDSGEQVWYNTPKGSRGPSLGDVAGGVLRFYLTLTHKEQR